MGVAPLPQPVKPRFVVWLPQRIHLGTQIVYQFIGRIVEPAILLYLAHVRSPFPISRLRTKVVIVYELRLADS
jgi:hypothetical protein